MVIGWVAVAHAAPVVCDPVEARRILVDARIDEERAPVTHPWLVPGLARDQDPAVSSALATVCDHGDERFIERAEAYQDAGWSAYALVVSSVERRGCSLVHHRVALSIGIGPDGPHYTLRGVPPDEQTPEPPCDDPAVWRDERVLAGEDEAVRLVLVTDHLGEQVAAARVVVRRATSAGWSEELLLDPAPPRTLDPDGPGPALSLARTRSGERLVVLSHDRTAAPCRPVGGQTVWRLVDGHWQAATGREALTLLAREGLWRYAGDDGWMLILAQSDEDEEALLEPRRRRLQRSSPEPLELLPSADFPGLYAGFAVVVPGPWSTDEEAHAARRSWGRRGYLKQAWTAPDACAEPERPGRPG